MMTQIAVTAVDIWLIIDQQDGIDREALFSRLKQTGRAPDLLHMALGWLVYEQYVKWTPGENGGRLFLVNPSNLENTDGNHREETRTLLTAKGETN